MRKIIPIESNDHWSDYAEYPAPKPEAESEPGWKCSLWDDICLVALGVAAMAIIWLIVEMFS